MPLAKWRVDKPSSDLIYVYEIKKKQLTDRLNKEILESISKEEAKKPKQKCMKCNHKWIARSDTAMRCPACHKNPY